MTSITETGGDRKAVGPLSLEGLAGILAALPPGGVVPPVSVLPELAARLVAGCTRLTLEEARRLPAAEAVELARACIETNDLAALVESSRRAIRLASGAIGAEAERREP